MANNKTAGIKEIIKDRALIASLSKNDLKTKFAGSMLGVVWAFVQPTVTILVYWFVFQVGLKPSSNLEFPFVLWLISGLVPWFYFSEALNGGTNSLVDYSYLVKKVVFKIDILPLVKIISSLFVHLFFTAFIIVLCWCYGYHPDLYTLQIFYYMICSIVLVTGLSYMTSAVVCFFRDLSQIVNIILQIGVWLTPIMWNIKDISGISPTLAKIFKLNPVYYIVDGFRDSMLSKIWFTEKWAWSLYFWAFTLIVLFLGKRIFAKLRVHFADVL